MTTDSRQLRIGRTVAVMLVLAVLDTPALLRMAVGPLLGVETSAALLLGIWSWLALLGVTASGLAIGRRWGAYLLLGLVPVSTVLLGIPLIPFVTGLTPAPHRVHATLVVNTLVLLTAPLLLQRFPTPLPGGVAGRPASR